MIKIIKSFTTTFSNKKTYDSTEIEQFLSDVRRFDKTIGSYEQHRVLHDQFTYSVELTNGTIRIYTEELEDKKALPQERLRDIAARFRERKTCLF